MKHRGSFAIIVGMLLLIPLFSGCLWARKNLSLTYNVDLSAFRIDQIKLLEEFNSDDDETFLNLLVVSNTTLRIPLGKSHIYKGNDNFVTGFYLPSVKLSWLKSNQLMRVSWQENYGQGFTFEGQIILLVAKNRHKEIFRDIFTERSRSGSLSRSSASLDIQYSESDRKIKIERFESYFYGSTEPSSEYVPFAKPMMINNAPQAYAVDVSSVTSWSYKLINDELQFLRGKKWLVLDDDYLISDISLYFKIPHLTLEQLNPSFQDAIVASGKVLLDDNISPYEQVRWNDESASEYRR